MSASNIIVAAFDGDPSSRHVAQRLEESWTGVPAPAVRALAAEDLEVEDLRDVDAVVLLVRGADAAARIRPALGALEEAGVAVLTLLDHDSTPRRRYEFMGALVEPADRDPVLLAAKLQGLVHRQSEVSRLRQEIAVAYRFHGGLKGEIARFHEELQLAAMVQREFLPRELPSLHGVEFAALWRPAHYVSGDIYDVARLDDDHIGVFIADAVGHGVPAALMTMVITRSLKTKVIEGSAYRLIEPSEVLVRLNDAMIRHRGHGTRFATAAYAVVNCRSRMMRLAGAGHPPPLLLRGDDCRKLETPGGLLGVFEDETYDQIEVPLEAGDRLLLYSDGFEQAFPRADANEYERRLPNMRYRDEFETIARETSTAEMIRKIGRRLDDQRGSLHQADDLTLVCMKAGALEAAEPVPAGAPALRLASP